MRSCDGGIIFDLDSQILPSQFPEVPQELNIG
jgi:hypothetical protein